ncbi:MAG: 4Fe-4S binding protein [Myxococcales bacterium]|nr:4Fe-4S binding protein [Myxococcales bacterium]
MSLAERVADAWDTVFRMLPHRAPTGLVAIGHPSRTSPVLLTCNYSYTVRRLRRILRGLDVWLLVANSNGINVWCAAGGGHLTHHDVISVIRTSRVDERVDQRVLILPQLGATGIERRAVEQATGWKTKWGPTMAEYLPEYLARGLRGRKAWRKAPFLLGDRLQMATMWGAPMALIGLPLIWAVASLSTALVACAIVLALVYGLFVALPRLRVDGYARWFTLCAAATLGALVGLTLLWSVSALSALSATTLSVAVFVALGVLSIDLNGTTPDHPSDINTRGGRPLVELDAERCTGAADCVLVCPRDVLQMVRGARKVSIAREADCIACGACVVQCPEDALHFRMPDGSYVAPETIRSTRMNMLGKRTISIKPASAAKTSAPTPTKRP